MKKRKKKFSKKINRRVIKKRKKKSKKSKKKFFKKKKIKSIKIKKNIAKIYITKVKFPNITKQIKQLKKINFIRVTEHIFRVFDKAVVGTADLISKPIKSFSNYRETKKVEKLKKIEKERREKEKNIRIEEIIRKQNKEKELREEIKIAKERKKDIKIFLRKEQAEIRKEQILRQKRFLEEIKLEKQVQKFREREIKELQNLEKLALKEERSDYSGLQSRIEQLKSKYKDIRTQAIRERVQALGVNVYEGDDRETILEKEKKYNLERQEIENCLESFYRSSASLCFQINKHYIPRHRSILRCVDHRYESGEIYIRWDDAPEEDWLLLIYIKNNSPSQGIIVEDKTNPEKNISHEFKTKEIFKASDAMVDSLIRLLERERKKKAS